MAGNSTPRAPKPPKPSPSPVSSGSRALRSGTRLPDPATANADPDPDPSKRSGTLRRSPRVLTPEGTGERSVYLDPEDSDLERPPSKKKAKKSSLKKAAKESADSDVLENAAADINGSTFFVGEPVPEEEARARWPHRYEKKGKTCSDWNSIAKVEDDEDISLKVKCHYLQANVGRCILNLGDCVNVKGEEKKPNYVGRILEFFETVRGEYYVRVQWFFRAGDTVMKEQAASHDQKRLFYSDLVNDNLLDCIVSKVRVVQISPSVESKSTSLPSSYYYYDMKYSVEYSTFQITESDDSVEKSDLSSSDCSGTVYLNDAKRKASTKLVHSDPESRKSELSLLDLYSGCGGMSTGLCLGAKMADVNLVTRWAVDFDEAACQSLKLNHPETQVRNEAAIDFIELLKKWDTLCRKYVANVAKTRNNDANISNENVSKMDNDNDSKLSDEEYEVSKIVDICYGDPTKSGERGLKFKVRWKGYAPSEDTWEPIENLSNCDDRIREFVQEGFKLKLLPLPGDVDVICGGPPCQGISGYNRFRNFDAPLEDDKNRQIAVFMDIVQFLKPKYVLMENVVDILKFAKATLARYAISRLVSLNYQARLGMLAAGCYGLPQFRLRAFLWGCHPCEKLPPFPLPTHEVILKGGAPVEFERNVVGYDEGQPRALEKALVVEDIFSDLPIVTNKEDREHIPYGKGPQNEFQTYIRTPKLEMLGLAPGSIQHSRSLLHDHRPLVLSEDDYQRICQIPKRKGANFRDLPGVIVASDNTAQFDPTMERVLLPSGKPLVPNYAMKLWDGKARRPLSRLWWDEIVPTVLTYPDIHIQTIIHPEQDRVLTIRETARVQGFPDCYEFCGTVKQRYRQVGNAVAVSVGRALGYTLGLAWLKQSGDGPLTTLPPKFSLSHKLLDPSSSSSGVQD